MTPHELAAVLSAVLQGYTRHSAQAELDRVFDAQYQLTLREEIQIRTYTDEDGVMSMNMNIVFSM